MKFYPSLLVPDEMQKDSKKKIITPAQKKKKKRFPSSRKANTDLAVQFGLMLD